MSQWTHINGSIRFDALRLGMKMDKQFDPRHFMGKTCNFNSSEADCDACDVPQGSEGSLDYAVLENPELNHLAAYVVPIWGDLRDKGAETIAEVEDWLKRISAGKLLRSGVVEVDVEYGETVVFHYEDGVWNKHTVKAREPVA